ncbi:MAG: phosphoribosylformylglycinamidine cyclo-ligase [Candidatus Kerfeldbacteria bacterium]|nr:phosphoribosylformylglycinamidine cyclo-ligase [Candidatus Kerfeldbacteria bacterium]
MDQHHGSDFPGLKTFKRYAQSMATKTGRHVERLGFRDVPASRGESAHLIECDDFYLAHVNEGLGTKNLVADAMYGFTGREWYRAIAQCTLASILNDLATCGASPLTVCMHLAADNTEWFTRVERWSDFLRGWQEACDTAQCTWGGGETPVLHGQIGSTTVVPSGSAVGIIRPKSRRIAGNIQAGDAIVFLISSGLHANGSTDARAVAANLPESYLTRLDDGRTLGEHLLTPTILYGPFIETCLDWGVEIHYAANITGGGWTKLMRPPQPFRYVIDQVPASLPVFEFLQLHGGLDNRTMFSTFNMGVGYALYVPAASVGDLFTVAKEMPGDEYWLLEAGRIEDSAEPRLVIEPLKLEYDESDLTIR